MANENFTELQASIANCTKEEQEIIFRELRKNHAIHEFEDIIGAPAEMILEAVHRAPELTRRMLRGVIADAAFRTFVIPSIEVSGWKDITPNGNFAYDYMVEDSIGKVSVQVKLQRSEKGSPVIRKGARFGFDGEVYITETQKTRTGSDGDEKTRPYRYGEFDILAVAMQPSTGKWDSYMYTLGRWLIQGKNPREMATLQPVATKSNEFWTNDFLTAATWFRTSDNGKRMSLAAKRATSSKIKK
jgi:hypothetical protein